MPSRMALHAYRRIRNRMGNSDQRREGFFQGRYGSSKMILRCWLPADHRTFRRRRCRGRGKRSDTRSPCMQRELPDYASGSAVYAWGAPYYILPPYPTKCYRQLPLPCQLVGHGFVRISLIPWAFRVASLGRWLRWSRRIIHVRGANFLTLCII